jgi:hypothetical protein
MAKQSSATSWIMDLGSLFAVITKCRLKMVCEEKEMRELKTTGLDRDLFEWPLERTAVFAHA